MPSESSIERAVCVYAKSVGVLPMKFTSPNRRGVPDRIFLASPEKTLFIEFKAPQGRLSALQLNEQRIFKKHGHTIHVVDSYEQGKTLIDEIRTV